MKVYLLGNRRDIDSCKGAIMMHSMLRYIDSFSWPTKS